MECVGSVQSSNHGVCGFSTGQQSWSVWVQYRPAVMECVGSVAVKFKLNWKLRRE